MAARMFAMSRFRESIKLSGKEIQNSFSESHWSRNFPPILSVEQVAALFQVPKKTVYDWNSRGLLPGCGRRIGKYVRFWRDRLVDQLFNVETNHE